MAKVTVLSPAGELQSAGMAIPPLPRSFEGLTVGFLDNTKHNFDHLVDGIGQALTERFKAKRIVHMKKGQRGHRARLPRSSRRWPRECDLVFSGSAD